MPPHVALLAYFICVLVLLVYDPAKGPKVSAAVWVPLIWMFFLASRTPAQWLNGDLAPGGAGVAEALEEGNPINRSVELGLLLLGIAILASRSFRWGKFFSRNKALMLYLSFALLSVLWSDFPFPAFKKWFRDLGNYVMVLVALSDSLPIEAVSTLLRRLGYLLIPLSVVFIKYFPDLGRGYDPFEGLATYCGAATSKNMLGVVCLVCGLYFFWDTVVRWAHRREKRTKRTIWINFVFILMTLWLLNTCDSATSRVCLLLGCIVILAAHSKAVQRQPGMLTVTLPLVFLLYVFLFFGLGLKGEFAEAVGRNPTLTGRTEIWQIVLSQHTNPLIGTGYESFWMGPRLDRIWAAGQGSINESHNGYLEAYVNLGYTGLFLLVLFVAACYRNICKRLKPFSDIASLILAIWVAFLFHNCSEVDFRSGLMWFVFVVGALAVSERPEQVRVQAPAPLKNGEFVEQVAAPL